MIRTVDGVVEFAAFEVELKDGSLFAFNKQELSALEKELTEKGVDYKVKNASAPSQAKKDKAKGVKYGSRSEALEHLDHGKEPEHVRKGKESKRIELLEIRVAELEAIIKGG